MKRRRKEKKTKQTGFEKLQKKRRMSVGSLAAASVVKQAFARPKQQQQRLAKSVSQSEL